MLENVYCFKISKRNQNASGCFPFLTERNWSEAVTRSAGIGPLQPPSHNWVSGLLATSSGDARRVRAKVSALMSMVGRIWKEFAGAVRGAQGT